jgi:hypothetical protein
MGNKAIVIVTNQSINWGEDMKKGTR